MEKLATINTLDRHEKHNTLLAYQEQLNQTGQYKHMLVFISDNKDGSMHNLFRYF